MTERTNGEDNVLELIKDLKEGDFDIRCKAAEQLTKLGVKAKAAVPALIEAIKGKDSQVAAMYDALGSC
jgi:HEAT repeat protein